VGILDTETGKITPAPADPHSDRHSTVWTPDGPIVANQIGLRATIWESFGERAAMESVRVGANRSWSARKRVGCGVVARSRASVEPSRIWVRNSSSPDEERPPTLSTVLLGPDARNTRELRPCHGHRGEPRTRFRALNGHFGNNPGGPSAPAGRPGAKKWRLWTQGHTGECTEPVRSGRTITRPPDRPSVPPAQAIGGIMEFPAPLIWIDRGKIEV